jgi:hypothetical protein
VKREKNEAPGEKLSAPIIARKELGAVQQAVSAREG